MRPRQGRVLHGGSSGRGGGRGRLGIKLERICREEAAPVPWAGAHPETSCRESRQPWGCGEADLVAGGDRPTERGTWGKGGRGLAANRSRLDVKFKVSAARLGATSFEQQGMSPWSPVVGTGGVEVGLREGEGVRI